MDQLFIINRYGEDTEKTTGFNEKRTQLLTQLVTQAKLRKKHYEESSGLCQNSEEQELDISSEIKETEPKDEQNIFLEMPEDTLTSNDVKDKVKKKRKRRDNSIGEEVSERHISESFIEESKPERIISKKQKITNEKEKNEKDVELQQDISKEVFDESSNEVTNTKDDNLSEAFPVLGEVERKQKEKVRRVLPDWLANPTVITVDLKDKETKVDTFSGLDSHLKQNLKHSGIHHFFPVQKVVIPWLLGNSVQQYCCRPQDICVSAPTGSGKTLAFVLPIIQALKSRVVCRVRALAVLPVRDLAAQVYNVFCSYCKGTSLRVGLAVGQKTFTEEQKTLVKQGVRNVTSLVDIVVATPGRIVDHIQRTPGFSLESLRYLVIDEADRMMEEITHGWLAAVEKAVFKVSMTSRNCPCTLENNKRALSSFPLTACTFSHILEPLQKLLYSATLSQDPEKLQQLTLFQPKLFTSITKTPGLDVSTNQHERTGEFVGKYTTPEELKEYYTICEPSIKPLVVWYFLKHKGFKKVLCFTGSVENTHRLCTLLKGLGGVMVQEFSSGLHLVKRKKCLKQFSSGKIDILVCSDAMARGIDVVNVDYVISYDPPMFVKTYIHRVGRTARAGREGTAITLLQKKEVRNFQKMLKSAGKERVPELEVCQTDLESYRENYRAALSATSKLIAQENQQKQALKNPGQKKKMKLKRVQNFKMNGKQIKS
ncbi:ATP-dependent RNA helicase DDX51-like [Limulus polyphemus]|uniref:ATP-dependent RNA helicase n=1 Tax=Limulus polyphemus TaxID=6850 RepID=A0ABM1B642_LIMPO|nr:ATP-dependent RNA helicase DDX51-like [Limulus polyphemus]